MEEVKKLESYRTLRIKTRYWRGFIMGFMIGLLIASLSLHLSV